MTHDEMIAVIRAHKEGKKIESKAIGDPTWHINTHPAWNFADFIYRVKPEPREWWVNVYESGEMGFAHDTEQRAKESGGCAKFKTIHVREVID